MDTRRHSPAAIRNRNAILGVLLPNLPSRGLVLEVASGSGEHITHFAAAAPGLLFQPSDADPAARASIDAWAASLGTTNVRPAVALDASSGIWPITHAEAVLCINMIHIAPWSAAVGLISAAARVLPGEGFLYLYGPYRRHGRHTSASNERFDADLRRQNPAWGVRDIEHVSDLAEAHGFAPPLIAPMPANNLSLIFRRRDTATKHG